MPDTNNTRFLYEDMLNLSWPQKDLDHPSMSLTNRAKIFLPFAALKGFDQAIQEQNRQHELQMTPNPKIKF